MPQSLSVIVYKGYASFFVYVDNYRSKNDQLLLRYAFLITDLKGKALVF